MVSTAGLTLDRRSSIEAHVRVLVRVITSTPNRCPRGGRVHGARCRGLHVRGGMGRGSDARGAARAALFRAPRAARAPPTDRHRGRGLGPCRMCGHGSAHTTAAACADTRNGAVKAAGAGSSARTPSHPSPPPLPFTDPSGPAQCCGRRRSRRPAVTAHSPPQSPPKARLHDSLFRALRVGLEKPSTRSAARKRRRRVAAPTRGAGEGRIPLPRTN